MGNFRDLVQKRRSVRKFTDQEIKAEGNQRKYIKRCVRTSGGTEAYSKYQLPPRGDIRYC